MTVWGLLREYQHYFVLILGLAMSAASAWRKRRAPSGKELWNLGKGLAGVYASLAFIVFLLAHSNSELSGQATPLSIAAIVLVVGSFVSLTRAVKCILTRDAVSEAPTAQAPAKIAATPPAQAHSVRVAHVASDAKPEALGETEASAEAQALADAADEEAARKPPRAAHVERDHAFTRFMMAMDARREEQLRALEEAKENREKDAEERAKDSATREEKADHRAHEALLRDRRQEARERLTQRVSRNETHWIKWATLVIAAAAVGQVAAASLQALAAFRHQSPATCTCASPAMPAPR